LIRLARPLRYAVAELQLRKWSHFTEDEAMLVLSRKLGEKLRIGDDITITLVSLTNGRAKLTIEAPRSRRILRGELLKRETAVIDRSEQPGTQRNGAAAA
jgi:carbon storage regulator